MNRSGYTEDHEDNWAYIMYRGAVKSAIRGKRGQAMLRELIQALDALPEKRLAANSLVNADGEYCALGALGRARGLDLSKIDPGDPEKVCGVFGVADALAREVMYLNDEYELDWKWEEVEICGPIRQGYPDFERRFMFVRVKNDRAPEERWKRMREWAVENLVGSGGDE